MNARFPARRLVRAFWAIALTALATLGASSADSTPRGTPSDAAPRIAVDVATTPLFRIGAVTPIRLQLSSDSIERLRVNPRTWVPARLQSGTSVVENIRVHLKGRTGSFQPIDAERPAFTLDFDPQTEGRRWHGLPRLHLNNSVEDPSLLHEWIGSLVFRSSGIPAPRVAHARVELNDRDLGLYVLKEAFAAEFLVASGLHADGLLGETAGGGDLDRTTVVKSPPDRRGERFSNDALLAALREPAASQRWLRVRSTLDTDRFIDFLALEVLLGHRDGYGLAVNNYRLLHDSVDDRTTFLPQGLDQLFGNPGLPWKPAFAGIAARALLETPPGAVRYRDRFRVLYERWLAQDVLEQEIDHALNALRPSLDRREYRSLSSHAADLRSRIRARAQSLGEQLTAPEPSPDQWEGDLLRLTHWTPTGAACAATPTTAHAAGDLPSALEITAESPTSASWRTRVRLEPGTYRFRGRVRVEDVVPLAVGRAQGAGLRIGGTTRPAAGVLGTTHWTWMSADFEVPPGGGEVECLCELRARSGRARFETTSLQVIRRVDPSFSQVTPEAQRP